MIICPGCKNEVQDDLDHCPICGYKFYGKRNSSSTLIVVVVISIIVAVLVLTIGKKVYNSYERNNYIDEARECYNLMGQGAVSSEEACHIIIDVWRNSILRNYDSSTDLYTLDNNGEFYDDFNDAINSLYADPSFQKRLTLINANQEKVLKKLATLRNPPDGCEEVYTGLMDFYENYDVLISSALNPKGNYESYLNNYNEADENGSKSIKRLNMLLQ